MATIATKKSVKKAQVEKVKKSKNFEKPSQEEYARLLEEAHLIVQERNEKCTQKWVTISPSEADEMLANNNIRNRKRSTGTASSYASQMTKGEWKANGEPIILSEPVIVDGVSKKIVMNGQHRLLACVMCGRPLPTLLVDGVPFDAMETLDTGKVRTGKDVLSASQIYADVDDFGEAEYVTASSIIKKVLEYCSGRLGSHGHPATRPAPTNANVVVDGMEYADVYTSVTKKIVSLRKNKDTTIEYFNKTAMMFVGYYMAWLLRNFGYSEQEVFPFFEKLVNRKYQGEDDDPIMSLRAVFKKKYDKNLNQSSRENYGELVMYDFFARAWNSYVKGEPRGKMNPRGVGRDSEKCTPPLERDAVEALKSVRRENALELAASMAL